MKLEMFSFESEGKRSFKSIFSFSIIPCVNFQLNNVVHLSKLFADHRACRWLEEIGMHIKQKI